MKKRILLALLFIVISKSFSQELPRVTLNDSSQLKLTSLKVDVKITGNFATTTYDMEFYNGLDRTLEGELAFPLGQGQSVSRFAMDINGKLREAVIVEKELARVAFESTVRQNIDPALLEKTEGNNYKARVYPILPKKHKKIVITYEQQLSPTNDIQTYILPLEFTNPLDNFNVNIEVYGTINLPTIKNNPYQGFFFKQKKDVFKASLERKGDVPNRPIILQIPSAQGKEILLTHNDYFYFHKKLKPNTRLKQKPKSITLLWDTSHSLKYRNLDEEISLLKGYFQYLQDVKVHFIAFNSSIQQKKSFLIKNGDWEILKKQINDLEYDGGTSFGLFEDMKIKSDEILLFSDGLSNLGFSPISIGRPVYTINSTVSSNHEDLEQIATISGGSYINLVRYPFTEGLKILKQETFQFLGYKKNGVLSEIYPNENINVYSDFLITGKFSRNTNLELLFGYQGQVTERIPVRIEKGKGPKSVQRLWAIQKLKSLTQDKEENKQQIISHAKQFYLVSDYTSLLILDRIEDYVKYRIEPPMELKERYNELLSDIEEDEEYLLEDIEERKEDLFEDYEDILEWYHAKLPKKKITKPKEVTSNGNVQQQNDTLKSVVASTPPSSPSIGASTGTYNTVEASTVIDPNNQDLMTVTGVLRDENGEPLPRGNIFIKGSSTGTQSDFDGNFSISTSKGSILVLTYIGYSSFEIEVKENEPVDVALEPDNSLEEVVIVAYAAQVQKQTLSYSVTTAVENTLAGRASGVDINGAAGSSTAINIRGLNSLPNTEPIYIVDGMVSSINPTKGLGAGDIESINVLKGDVGTKIYGSRGVNGVVVITTKKGLENNKGEIEKLNEQISEKIELKSWNPDTPYIDILKKEPSTERAYQKYLEIRDDYSNIPSFYLDVSDFFNNKGASKIAMTVLTNLIEIELNNHELMKALAYKLEYFKEYQLAVTIYKKILQLRPEEPQSYRDLALAYEGVGEFQECFDLLYKIYNGDLLEKDEDERYYGIEHIAFVELNRLVSKYGRKIKMTKEQKSTFKRLPVDIRVVVDWNHNDTDIDLWVTDPNGEETYYGNKNTQIGGHLSEDIIDGYGPEEFMLKKAIRGEYKVLIDYYSDNTQKISGPTNLKLTLYTGYGTKKEKKEIVVVRLDKEEDELEVGKLYFKR